MLFTVVWKEERPQRTEREKGAITLWSEIFGQGSHLLPALFHSLSKYTGKLESKILPARSFN